MKYGNFIDLFNIIFSFILAMILIRKIQKSIDNGFLKGICHYWFEWTRMHKRKLMALHWMNSLHCREGDDSITNYILVLIIYHGHLFHSSNMYLLDTFFLSKIFSRPKLTIMIKCEVVTHFKRFRVIIVVANEIKGFTLFLLR